MLSHFKVIDQTVMAAYTANPGGKIVDVRPLMPNDYLKIDVRPEQTEFHNSVKHDYGFKERMIMNTLYGINAIHEGKSLVVAGAVPIYKHSAYIWMLVDKNFREAFKQNPKGWVAALKKYASLLPFERLETDVIKGFKEGHVIMRALGFKKEGLMLKSGPGKEDQYKYSLTKSQEEIE